MKLAIVHYQPIEYYPPVCNLLNEIASLEYNFSCCVFTTNHSKYQQYVNKLIGINRTLSFENVKIAGIRLIGYYYFNVFTFLGLVIRNPDAIIYFESYSALPGILVLQMVWKKQKTLDAFAHEYFSKEWYSTGMKTVNHYHIKEIDFLYTRANGLSHTNTFRIDLFLKDYPWLHRSKMNVIPNYPPKKWISYNRKLEQIQQPIKTVYIGSLSLRSTHIQTYCEWLIRQNGNVLLDIYSTNADDETKQYFNSIESPFVRFFSNGIEYENIPIRILTEQYQIGLILYNGGPLNTVYCASNKLFEYLVCGLDVWFSQDMLGTYPYITQQTYPKVIKVDFSQMKSFDSQKSIDRSGLTYKPYTFNCKEAYTQFLSEFSNNIHS